MAGPVAWEWEGLPSHPRGCSHQNWEAAGTELTYQQDGEVCWICSRHQVLQLLLLVF